ncbi:transcription factor Adf-1-like isoform X2 [Anastrepha ludens]|uniref:transcription factor Adf-1-like isoform X2 n=1 Tax=Anastrepha ludens TaxID=28586 RepID=UPI0023AF651B|nr:transcription factor Adf-1-like isoform X2 [Anastrepha ludens]
MSFERRVIAEVQKYECLYNMQALNYKDAAFKDKLWQKVAQKCGSNVEECKKKWKHLRDCYNRCKKRDLLYSKQYPGDTRRKIWRYKNQMDFLSPFFNQKQSLKNRDTFDYDDDFGSPVPTQATDESSGMEESTKVGEICAENESIEAESFKELDPDEIDPESVETMFTNFVETTIPPVSNVCGLRKEEEGDSTTLMFKLLDRKIKQAALTEAQISDMETSVMLFVYKKLSEYKKKNKTLN